MNQLDPFRKTRFAAIVMFLTALLPLYAAQTPREDSCFVYPSPASGASARVVYLVSDPGKAYVQVYNEAGDLVVEMQQLKPSGVQETVLDLTYYRKGLYICRVTLISDSMKVKKLRPFKFTVLR